MDITYSEAAVEVLEILEHTRKEDVEKISKNFLDFLKEHSSTTYESNLDHTKTIKEMNLNPKTEALLGIIYLKYWADEQEKIKFLNECKKRENIYQEELKKMYNSEKLFKQKESIIQKQLPIEIKQKSFLQKIINKIKNIFRR